MPAEIFDGTTARLQTAKAACAHCTVARQCLRWALTNEIEDEIWGGRTPAERRRITVAFVLDPPPILVARPNKSVAQVEPGVLSEKPIAEQLRSVRSRCPRQESCPHQTSTERHCPRSQDPHQRSGRVRDRGRLQRHVRLGEADLCGLPTGGPGCPGRPRRPARRRCPRRDPIQGCTLRHTRRLQPTPEPTGKTPATLPQANIELPADVPHSHRETRRHDRRSSSNRKMPAIRPALNERRLGEGNPSSRVTHSDVAAVAGRNMDFTAEALACCRARFGHYWKGDHALRCHWIRPFGVASLCLPSVC